MKNYLGIDVGGTKIKYGVYSQFGKEIDSGIVDSERSDLNKFIKIIEDIKNKYENIEGVGLSLPCVLNSNTGVILEAGNITAIEGANIKSIFEKKLGVKVEVENDANCVALAEKWIGNGKNNSNFICVTIGTGIGGSIIINDKLYTGRNFVAGEFGFMVIDKDIVDDFEKDYGHLASTTALVELVELVKNKEENKIDGHYIFNKLKEKDDSVKNVYNKWLTNLAFGIRNLCFILDPEKILLGGGVSAQGKILIDLKKRLEDILPDGYNLWDIETCKYFNDSGKIGAIYNLIQKNIQ